MWIKVRSQEGPSFSLPLPLWMFKSRWIWRLAEKHGGKEAAQYAPLAQAVISELAAYVRANGHFTLVDVESADGEIVKIIV